MAKLPEEHRKGDPSQPLGGGGWGSCESPRMSLLSEVLKAERKFTKYRRGDGPGSLECQAQSREWRWKSGLQPGGGLSMLGRH